MVGNLDCRNRNTYFQTIRDMEETFHKHYHELQKVTKLAKKIKDGIERISPLIQQTTQIVCPACKEVCCISKHGHYNYEDLVYLHALGLKPHGYEFGRKDSDPCQFLSEDGCSMERSLRPSGCNWYFCDPLLEQIEKRPYYREFDNSLSEIAELWMKMMEEFELIFTRQHKGLLDI